MATISVLNTSADLSGKTVVTAEGDRTITGLLSFSRSTSAPFAVNVNAANVANLDADLLDGQHGTYFAGLSRNDTITGQWTFSTPPIGAGGDMIQNEVFS